MRKTISFLAAALCSLGCWAEAPPDAGAALVQLRAASPRPSLAGTPMLGVTRAGARIVAVGDGGTVALSDDNGRSFRRARSVPVQLALTAVSFADDRRGWAVGHAGVVLHTEDAGETWTLQRADTTRDQPLFDVHFTDAQHGLAVGLWSLMLRTADGGQHWQAVALPPPEGAKKADRNLFHLFADAQGALYVTAEGGAVLRSADGGLGWRYLSTGYTGSLWAGLALPGGTLLVGGLRGTLLRSEDGGASWQPIKIESKGSITSLAADGVGGVVGTGLEGLVLHSSDGRRFAEQRLAGAPALTSTVAADGGALIVSAGDGVSRIEGAARPAQ